MNVTFMMQQARGLARGFASKMQAGSTKNNKDSAGRRLGVKKLGNNEVMPNDIIARQRGLKWHPGKNTYLGRDHTIHSKVEGVVQFERSTREFKKKKKRFIMHVVPMETKNPVRRPPPHMYHPELFPAEIVANNPHQIDLTRSPQPQVPRSQNTIVGRGRLNGTPLFRSFIQVHADMIPVRPEPFSMNDQILERLNKKISTLIDEDIVLKTKL